jgi:hypothetical protein
LLQHQSYKKCFVGTLGTCFNVDERLESNAADNNVTTCPPPDFLVMTSNNDPISVDSRIVPHAAKWLDIDGSEFDKHVNVDLMLPCRNLSL